jgi:threonine synthase
MKYISTRGQAPKINFSDTLITGLASDGGLYLPENYPQLSKEILEELRDLSYPDLAFAIMKLFIDEDDIPHDDLRVIINMAQPWLLKILQCNFLEIFLNIFYLKKIRL